MSIPSEPPSGSPPEKTRSTVDSGIAVVAGLALMVVLLARLGLGLGSERSSDSGGEFAADEVPGFSLHEEGQPATDPQRFVGGVYLTKGNRQNFSGTFLGSDAFTGRVVSSEFLLRSAWLRVPICGYPATPGNRLTLEILDAEGRVAESLAFTAINPREIPGTWDVPTFAWQGRTARLALEDGLTIPGGWLAVGTPLIGMRRGPPWLDGLPRNYGWYAICATALAGLIFIPGLVWRSWHVAPERSEAFWLPLPGLAILAIGGACAWQGGRGSLILPVELWLAANALGAFALAIRWRHGIGLLHRAEREALGIYACVVVGALAFGALPLEVAQEYDARTASASRMIASPPDHIIPYRTAAFFFHGKESHDRQNSDTYFGSSWSVASRGPLAPWVVLSALIVFNSPPSDPPRHELAPWPAAREGFYVARLVGVLTNALVVLGAAALAAQLAPTARRLALIATSVAPVTAINVDFVWPKLVAAFFVLLAIRAALLRQPLGWPAFWSTLAYLSHPVGGIFAPALGVFIIVRAWHEHPENGGAAARARLSLAPAVRFASLCAAFCLPWLIFKLLLGRHDVFLDYPLGDGRGFEPAAGLGSWLLCRWHNLWFTLAPGAYYFSTEMKLWLEGPLSEPLRWAASYAKTLPGNLGFVFFGTAAVALARRQFPAPAGFRRAFLGAAFMGMLFFWGFSSNGLGRNCLEPLSLLVVVAATIVFPAWTGWRWVLLVTAIECVSIRIIGVVCASSFNSATVNTESPILAGIAIGASLLPAFYYFRHPAATPDALFPPLKGGLRMHAKRVVDGVKAHAGPLCFLLVPALLLLRKPHALSTPQLWAEDGSVFFVEDLQLGWHAFYKPYAGYLHLLPRIVAAAAHPLDPAFVPAIYNGVSFIGWCIAAISVLSPRLPLPGKPWLALAVALVPQTGEVLFQLCNLQWATALLLVRQLMLRPAETRRERIGDGIMLGLVGLTGPFSVVLWPLFAWRTWRHRRNRAAWMEFAIITAAAGAHLVSHLNSSEPPPPPLNLQAVQGMAAFVGQRSLAVILLGWDFAGKMPPGARLGCFAALVGLLGLAGWQARKNPVHLLATFACAGAATLVLGATLVRGGPAIWASSNIYHGDRYLFLPRVLLLWVAVIALASQVRARWLLAVLLAWTVWINRTLFVVPAPPDYEWRKHAPLLRGVNPADIPTLPEGWTLRYPGRSK